MGIHFDTLALAVEHLRSNGWNEVKNGSWVSKDKTCKATIHPIGLSPVVLVAASLR